MCTVLLKRSCLILLMFPFACREQSNAPSKKIISQIDLKRGDIINCGPPNQEYGELAFNISANKRVKDDFMLAVKMLHSFEYDEAEKVFARIIDREPGFAMAYWGVAMSNFHPLWSPPTEAELRKGSKAIEIARSLKLNSERETGYINAVEAFYKDWNNVDHRTRCLNFEMSMEELHAKYPEDKEAAIFYSLALNAAADPADKTFAKQKKAGAILSKLYPEEENHPGVIHYLIHTYDSPELAPLGLVAARKYASVAPSSAHALHMPSHIFTRLGLWDEGIRSNIASVASAKCYAESAGIKGHWDEELHGMDYLVYGYLQTGENDLAKEQYDYLRTMTEVQPINFKVAYAFAAIPARYMLENRLWKEAANMETHYPNFPWEEHAWQKAIVHFARLMGSVNTGDKESATTELEALKKIHKRLLDEKDPYKANQVEIQIKTGEAWMKLKEGNNAQALELMQEAAEMEDKTEKHPVTPGEVIPAREQLADLLMQMNKYKMALDAYEEDLRKHPNRFNGLYGAGMAAEKAGNREKANRYYRQLLAITKPSSNRAELKAARQFLKLNDAVVIQH